MITHQKGLKENPDSGISVIVPFHGKVSDVRACLHSLLKSDPAPQEIIIVVDGQVNDSVEELADAGARLIRLPYLSPRGPAVARNAGARRATGEILLFIDSDVTVPPTLIGDVRRIMVENHNVAGLIGSYDDAPDAINPTSLFRNLLHHYVHQHGCLEAVTFWGACGAIRRGDFFEAGGFDELFGRPSIEDIELGYRLHAKGRRIILCKELQIKHLKQWRLRSMLKTDLLDRAVPWTRLILRSRHFGHELNLGHSHRCGVIFSFMMAVSLPMAWLHFSFLFLALESMVALMLANSGFLRFALRLHGKGFALNCFGFLWLHYLTAGLGFVMGLTLGKIPSDHGLRPMTETMAPTKSVFDYAGKTGSLLPG